MFLCASDMIACGASDQVIQITIVDLHLSEGVRRTLLLDDVSFLISVVNLRSYNG